MSGSPYTITASAAVGGTDSDLADYDISYVTGADGEQPRPDDHRRQHQQDVRPDGDFRRHGIHQQHARRQQRPGNGDSIASVTLSSPGAAARAT